jgi:hypothetical protein
MAKSSQIWSGLLRNYLIKTPQRHFDQGLAPRKQNTRQVRSIVKKGTTTIDDSVGIILQRLYLTGTNELKYQGAHGPLHRNI